MQSTFHELMEAYFRGWGAVWVKNRVMCVDMAPRMRHPITFPGIRWGWLDGNSLCPVLRHLSQLPQPFKDDQEGPCFSVYQVSHHSWMHPMGAHGTCEYLFPMCSLTQMSLIKGKPPNSPWHWYPGSEITESWSYHMFFLIFEYKNT